MHVTEPDTGDFLVKLRPDRKHETKDVIADVRKKLTAAQPHIFWEFPGIIGDLIGDLTVSPEPIEVKLYSTDLEYLKKKAPEIKEMIKKVEGVVDEKDGLVVTGAAISFRVRSVDAAHFGLTADDIAKALNTALLGQEASTVLQGDRVVAIRVKVDPAQISTIEALRQLPLRAANGSLILLSQVADIREASGDLELHREDLRQIVSITARLEGRDLGSAMDEIRAELAKDKTLSPGMVAFGGLYEQQQESFRRRVRRRR
jgi:Cu/Ag efflux pump CusA